MSSRSLQTHQEMEDLIRGLTLFGVGGGGHMDVARHYLKPHFDSGEGVTWKSPDDISDDAWTCCVFGMGSVALSDPLSPQERQVLGYENDVTPFPMVEAVKELEAYTGHKIEALIPFEPGPVPVAASLDAAMRLGIDFWDADYCGRAVPKLTQTLLSIAGHKLWPAAIVDSWGNRLILMQAPSSAVAEYLGKMISIVTKRPDPFALCAHAGFVIKVKTAKDLVVRDSVSRAYEAGAVIRQAREAGDDPVDRLIENLEGWKLFSGEVTDCEWKSEDGYMFATINMQGEGAFKDHSFRLWLQNENHITWLDGEPNVTSPDLIMVVNVESGEPYISSLLCEGEHVAVLGCKCDQRYRSGAALEVMEPRYFGFDIDFRPIEQIAG